MDRPGINADERVDTTPITPIRARDHAAVSAIFPCNIQKDLCGPAPVTVDDQGEWRWFVEQATQSTEEQGRAASDLQPTVLYGFEDGSGLRRLRPVVAIPEGRHPNDYDHLLDLRSYSPNSTPRGYWNFDPEEIERENAFNPVQPDPPTRTPSSIPEPGSLEAALSGSLAEPRPPSHGGAPIFDDYDFRSNAGIRRHEVRDFALRFRALPPELQRRVIRHQEEDDLLWIHALQDVESQVWLFNLTPRKREVVYKVQRLHRTVNDDIENENRIGAELRRATQDLLIRWWPISNDREILRFLEPMRSEGAEHGTTPNGRESVNQGYWLSIINVADTCDLTPLRENAVLRLFNNKRAEMFVALSEAMSRWLHNVGDVEEEAAGVHQRGDFWTVSEEWEPYLEYLEDR